jgi:hypothetical protein
MITNPEDLKTLSESRIVSKDPNEKNERRSLSERMREKLHNTLYSGEEPPVKKGKKETEQIEGSKE